VADPIWLRHRQRAIFAQRGVVGGTRYIGAMLWRQGTGFVRHRLAHPGTFTFDGQTYPYLVHPHNLTWDNERTVEVPIAQRAVEDALARGARILEVGNVLSHYGRIEHEVLDKYEPGRGVIAADVVDWTPPHLYDLIVSISTLEHVGWDESPREPDKVARALAHLRGMLATHGRLLVTLPLGYNAALDGFLAARTLPLERIVFLQRAKTENRWAEATWAMVSAEPAVRDQITAIAVGFAGPGRPGP
jgi:hypothetical protein